MYKNKVKNNRKSFEIPTLSSCEQENPEWKNSNLFSAEFPRLQDKRVGISRISVVLYPIFICTYPGNYLPCFG